MHLEDIEVRIGKNRILSALNADFEKGAINVVIGPNGSGKTTMLRCAAGLLKPVEGKAIIDSINIHTVSNSQLSSLVSYLPQSLPKPAVSVDNLVWMGRFPNTAMGRTISQEDTDAVKTAFETTGMGNFKNRLVCHLSGGERTMAFITMMLARRTPVVILDEPFASLDVSAVRKTAAILRTLADSGISVVVSVHDIPLALEIADRVIVMDRGSAVFEGSPDEAGLEKAVSEVFGVSITRAVDPNGVTHIVHG